MRDTTPPPSDAALDVAAVAAEARALLDAATPGPWDVDADGCLDVIAESPEHPSYVDTVAAIPQEGAGSTRASANAALIAAAPAMLRHVVALAARVTAAEAAHAALAGAVREYLRREADASIARETVEMIDEDATFGDDEESAELTDALREMGETGAALRVARKGVLDALLRGAPGGYVRASVVQRYMHATENSVDAGEMIEARGALVDALAAAGSACRSDDDGDCRWNRCPQRLDGEPWVTGRVCPLTKET